MDTDPHATEQLQADQLDQALDALRSNPTEGLSTWSERWSSQLGVADTPSLLETLREVEAASGEWRQLRRLAAAHDQAHSQTVAGEATTPTRAGNEGATAYEPAATPAPGLAFPGGGPATLSHGPPAETPPAPGRALQEDLPERIGRYQIQGLVGKGGMGQVYRALDPDLHRVVAVKVPLAARGDVEFRRRFLREARAAATVRHPHVCPIHDVGEQDGRPFVVMAFVEGEPLDQRLRRLGRFTDVRRAVELARQVAEALGAVHQHGIIHRDLKPGNILLDREEAILSDFGLARALVDDEHLSSPGAILGTPAYMAPEQATGDQSRLGPATDLYSLGVVLFQMLTGRLPFEGQLLTLVSKLANEPAPPPSRFREDLDPALDAIVLRLLAKSPQERFSSAAEVAETLEQWLAGQARGLPLTAAVAPAPTPVRWFSWVLGLVGLALAVSLAVVLTLWPARETQQDQTDSRDDPPRALPQPPAGRPAARELPLEGELTLSIWGEPGKDARHGQQLGTPNSLPVRTGDMLRLDVVLKQPAHVYLVWITSQGRIYPLHPWDPHWGFQAPPVLPPPGPAPVVVASLALLHSNLPQHRDEPRQRLTTPSSLEHGWEVEGSPGVETVLLLGRRTRLPLELARDLPRLIGKPGPSRPGNSDQFDWLAIEEGRLTRIDPGRSRSRGPQSRRINDPLVEMLGSLQPYFELLQGVRFAHAEE